MDRDFVKSLFTSDIQFSADELEEITKLLEYFVKRNQHDRVIELIINTRFRAKLRDLKGSIAWLNAQDTPDSIKIMINTATLETFITDQSRLFDGKLARLRLREQFNAWDNIRVDRSEAPKVHSKNNVQYNAYLADSQLAYLFRQLNDPSEGITTIRSWIGEAERANQKILTRASDVRNEHAKALQREAILDDMRFVFETPHDFNPVPQHIRDSIRKSRNAREEAKKNPPPFDWKSLRNVGLN